MTLDEISRLIEAAAAAGAAETTVFLAGCTLVLRHDATPALSQPAAPGQVLRAPALPAPGHPVVTGEAVGFLEVGPCLLPIIAPAAGRPGPPLVPDGTLVGYGTPLLPLDTPP